MSQETRKTEYPSSDAKWHFNNSSLCPELPKQIIIHWIHTLWERIFQNTLTVMHLQDRKHKGKQQFKVRNWKFGQIINPKDLSKYEESPSF